MDHKPTACFQIKVTLRDSQPAIWRRILVPMDTSLARLHIILQAVMGWENYHLHAYNIHEQEFGDPANDEWGDRNIKDERDYCLGKLDLIPGSMIEYVYDFGDGWIHDLEIEAIHLEWDADQLPSCLDGEFSGPPEDVGGIGGYYEYVRALKNRHRPEHKEWLAWRGPFDPTRFEIGVINKRLFWLSDEVAALDAGLNRIDNLDLVMAYYPSLTHWASGLDDSMNFAAHAINLRRDMVVMLNYLSQNKVRGTQSTGNLPLKQAQEISAQFVHPPAWKISFGDYVSHVRSSADIWEIYFLLVLAEVGELVSGGTGRRIRVLDGGNVFLAAPPALQIWYMLAVWWTRVNWMIGYPYEISINQIDFEFVSYVGVKLFELPIDQEIPVEAFADRLVEGDQFSRNREFQEQSLDVRRRLVRLCVIQPLIDLGILLPKYRSDRNCSLGFKELEAFKISSFGKHFLEPLVFTGQWSGSKM